MTDEEIRDEAKITILRKWAEINHFAESDDFFLKESLEGNLEFFINVNEASAGKAKIIYSPQPFVEMLIKKREVELQDARKLSLAAYEISKLYWGFKVELTTRILLGNLKTDIRVNILEQGFLALSAFYEGTKEIPQSKRGGVFIRRKLSKFAKNREERIKFFTEEVELRYTAPQLIFRSIYDEQVEFWKEVKACYKKVKKCKNPLGMVKTEYPHLPGNLLENLTLDNELGQPSKLALLATAMITNVPKGKNAIRTLQAYLEGSKKLQAKASKEEINEALQQFSNVYHQNIDHAERIKSLVNDLEHQSNKAKK